MTRAAQKVAHGVARHNLPESFRVFADRELQRATPWRRGVCFLPECGRAFEPSRDWQMYCCHACERAGVAELRRWGHRLAFSELVHRLGKYETRDAGLRDLSRAARRHISHVQTLWIQDRRDRAERGQNVET